MQFQPSPFSDQPVDAPAPGLKLSPAVLVGAGALVVGGLLVMPLVVVPFALSAVVPEWSYGRRVAAGLGLSLALGAAGGLARSVHARG